MFNKHFRIGVCSVLFILLATASMGALAAHARVVTLSEVILSSLRQNPELLAAQANERQKKHELRSAFGDFLPSVFITWARGQEHSKNPTLQAAGLAGTDLWRQENSIEVDQPVFTGGRNIYNFKSKRYEFHAAQYSTDKNQIRVLYDIIASYLSVMRNRQIVALSVQNVRIHVVTLDKVYLRYHGGAGRASEVNLAKARLALARSRLVRARGDLQVANAQYLAATGSLPPVRMALPNYKQWQLPKNLQQAVSIALNNNPSLLESQETSLAAHANVGVARSPFYPRVDVRLSASDNSNLDGIEGTNDDRLAMLVVTYNLFRGGSDKAELLAAKEEENRIQDDVEFIHRGVIENVRTAWHDLFTSRLQVTRLSSYVRYSRQVVLNYVEEFKIGQKALFNVLDAENELYLARVSLINATYDSITGVYQLFGTMGKLSQFILPPDRAPVPLSPIRSFTN